MGRGRSTVVVVSFVVRRSRAVVVLASRRAGRFSVWRPAGGSRISAWWSAGVGSWGRPGPCSFRAHAYGPTSRRRGRGFLASELPSIQFVRVFVFWEFVRFGGQRVVPEVGVF